jgi:hypothetical protein
MKSQRAIFTAFLTMLMASCSSLHVRPIDDPDARGIPFYLPRQSIVLEELGFDENGKIAQVVDRRVAIVTGPDLERGWRVANAPHWFANSKFSIERSTGGVVSTVSGEVEDQLVETVVELAKISASLAGGIAMAPLEAGALNELPVQEAIERALLLELQSLSQSTGPKASQAEKIEKALAQVRSRIAGIKAERSKKSKGVNVSKRSVITPVFMRSFEDIEKDLEEIPDGALRVYIAPVK